jgi:hypothetical protein
MGFVTDAARFADRQDALVDAAPDAAAHLARVHSRVVIIQPRTSCHDTGQRLGCSRWGLFSLGVWKVRLRSWPALHGLPQPVNGPAIAENCELCPEARFDKVGVGGCQRVLDGQASMGPAGRLVGGLKGVEFGDQPMSQCGGLIVR